MGSPLIWKVNNKAGKLIASTADAQDAAMIVAAHGDGTRISCNHGPTLWMEGEEEFPAIESAVAVSRIVNSRQDRIDKARRQRQETRDAEWQRKVEEENAIVRKAMPEGLVYDERKGGWVHGNV